MACRSIVGHMEGRTKTQLLWLVAFMAGLLLVLYSCASPARLAPWELQALPDPTDTELHLFATEQVCASGRRADGRASYELVETSLDVTITVTIVEPDGDQECPSNPPTPLTVDLAEPWAGRILIDGRTGSTLVYGELRRDS